MRLKSIISSCFIVLFFSGCAAPRVYLKPANPPGASTAQGSLSWHQLRFKWSWPKGQNPDWSLDLVVADRVLSGIIEQYQPSLPLWRFHRRAARDRAGDQFAFIFYSSDAIARDILDIVNEHPMIHALRARGLLERVYMTQPAHATELSATSDPHWPKDLQQAWPMFIMGVSQTWLALVQIHARDDGISSAASADNVGKELQLYSKVSDEINRMWMRYAQHAFFHHLSAVFGYAPLVIRDYIRF